MNFISVATDLASQVEGGGYTPTALDACEASLTPDRYPQLVRFVEFTLFTERPRYPLSPPRFLVLQPQRALAEGRSTEQERIYGHSIVDPFIRRWRSDNIADRVPDPAKTKIARLRQAITELDDESSGEPHAVPRWRSLPDSDGSEQEFRASVARWVSGHTDNEVRRTLRSVSALVGVDVTPPVSNQRLTAEDLADTLRQLAFPGPYQLLSGRHWPIALCATFEQTWQPRGYTKGELVGSLSLAPGERLTLEVHTWDKSSRRSEEELSVDFEMRTSEKSTQRDAQTVAQEFAQQTDTSVRASGTIPIPKMPIGVSAQTASQTRDSLRRTTENVRERTLEASTTLKLNRKTRIEISRETGREEKQTRTLENTNRCHTLNCHYFEIVANYLVTTRLAGVRPCVLLRYTRPVFTLSWILCHEDILVKSLLDRTFLPGFEGARAAKVSETIAQMEARERLAQLDALGEQVAPFAAGISRAYAQLTDARDEADAAFEELGPGSAYGIVTRLGPLGYQRLVSYFGLQPAARLALDALTNDLDAGRNAAAALRGLLSLTSPDLPPRASADVARELNDRYRAWGGELDENEVGTRFAVQWDLLAYDDAGLRDGLQAAFDFLSRAPLVGVTPVEAPDPVDPEVAAAYVEAKRLQCHLNDHWLHYAQAVWMREDHDQRMLRLQTYGPIISFIGNELLGFYGDRGAFPLLDTSLVDEVDLTDLSTQIDQEIAAAKPEPVLITMPTPGVVMEAVTGECDACEDYIDESRVIDLRLQAARAGQEEAEAERRQRRLAENNLADPDRQPGHLVVEVRNTEAAPGDGPP